MNLFFIFKELSRTNVPLVSENIFLFVVHKLFLVCSKLNNYENTCDDLVLLVDLLYSTIAKYSGFLKSHTPTINIKMIGNINMYTPIIIIDNYI